MSIFNYSKFGTIAGEGINNIGKQGASGVGFLLTQDGQYDGNGK